MSRSLTLPNKISTNNVRAASTLAAGAVYQGTGELVTGYGRAGISITSTNKTDGVLTIEVSRDGVTYGGPNRTFADTRFSQPHMWNIVEPYFRIKYTNGNNSANDLAITVQYSNNADILLGHQLDETLIDETEAIVTRSVLVGRDSRGEYANVPVTNTGRLEVDTQENDTTRLLEEVLEELKIMNFYNYLTHNVKITSQDVEE